MNQLIYIPTNNGESHRLVKDNDYSIFIMLLHLLEHFAPRRALNSIQTVNI